MIRRRLLVGLALGVLGTAAALALSSSSVGQAIEDQTYDWRLRSTARPADARRDIVLVLINESSLRALEPAFGGWPLPRLLHAGVIDFLAQSGARVIAYDVLFVDRDRRSSFSAAGRQVSGADSDNALIDAVRRAGNVVLLADAQYEGLERQTADSTGTDRIQTTYRLGPGFPTRLVRGPVSELAAGARAIGHNFMTKDSGGIGREMAPFVDAQGAAVPSLGLAAALALDGTSPDAVRLDGDRLRIGARAMPLIDRRAQGWRALLNFHGPFRTVDEAFTYPTYSFFDVLLSEDQKQSGQTPAIDPSAFRDKIVFVGTSADGLGDIWQTPFNAGGMPGVQLHAALADDVLSGRFMRQSSRGAGLALTGATALSAGIVATMLPVAWAISGAVIAAAALVFALTRVLAHGLWLPVIAPLIALFTAAFGGVAWRYFVEDREKRRVTKLFGRYVSKDVVELLMANPSVARLGGERREMSVLFSDIRGFTSASERGAPEAIVGQLNEYFTAMVEVLFRHRGTLDKFVGDMVMGLFGAPIADPQHADHAVATAREMIAVLDRLNAGWTAAGRPSLQIGIGINSGEMIAGNIGSDTIMSYTVIGDAVNLGARLESLNKDYGTRILISDDTRRRLTTPVDTRLIGDVVVKGRSQPATVYEVRT